MTPVFIYVKHTPKTMRIFASDQVTPLGEKKAFLTADHVLYPRVLRVVDFIDDFLAEHYPGRRVTLERIARSVVIPGVDLVHLKGNETTPDRILLKFETCH